jgi:predicted nuclease of restriction endonuclease-like (RecB) superfamily
MTLPKKKSRDYSHLVSGIAELLETARRASVRSVNAIMTAAYWMIGRRIVEFAQKGELRAEYGEELIERLAADLSARYGRGFSVRNVWQMKAFYLAWPTPQTMSAESEGREILQTVSAESFLSNIASCFPLPWSAYVRLLSVKNENARRFYGTEALRGGWSLRQLDRQIESQFYERTALSKNKAAMLQRGAKARPGDTMTPEEEIKDPYILEFLGLKDEYSESDLEEALIRHLEVFLLDLGGDFSFVARQKRLRVGDEWYRVDLVFFHRRLRCLLLIDLKLGKFTHADAGQMHLYLNYACENWVLENENPPVGLILCAHKDAAVAKYALENLRNKVLASEYRTVLPDEKVIAAELEHTRHLLDMRMRGTLALAPDKKKIKPRRQLRA